MSVPATGGPADYLTPLVRPGPLRHQVQEALRERIISRQLAPGAHLVEVELAEQLGVSRQPVREALQSLQAQGWVELRPGRGAFVHDPTDAEVDDVFAVRVMLEPESARRAAGRADEPALQRMWALCVDGRAALATDDADGVVHANAALHREISVLAGNRVLHSILVSLDHQVRWYFTPLARIRGTGSWDEHEELIETLAAGAGDAAADIMRAHTERSWTEHRRLRGRADAGGR